MANLLLVASLDVRTWVLIATSCRRLAWRNWGEGISWAQALTLFLQLPQFSLRQNGFELCCTLNFQGGWHHQCLPSQVSKTWLSPGFFGGSEHRTGLTWEPLGLPSQPARFGSKWRREDPEALFNNLVTSLLSRWKTLGLYIHIYNKTYIYIYTHMYIYIYTHMYIYIYIQYISTSIFNYNYM